MQAGLATDNHKIDVDDYLASAVWLFQSMAKWGFDPDHAVPIDPDGELLNGSHRVACALALGIKEIPVDRQERMAWAPAWDAAWFRSNGLPEPQIAALEAMVARD